MIFHGHKISSASDVVMKFSERLGIKFILYFNILKIRKIYLR
jgi:hypothetical protein